MNLVYNPHIHPCLSSCGDDDMTPANTADTAALKGLGVAVLTNHNVCRNCPVFMAAAAEYGMLAVPGAEIDTSEEVHAMCLFLTLGRVLDFGAYVCGKLIKFPSREETSGKQQICDGRDQVCASEFNLLINTTEISSGSLWSLAHSYDGVVPPAHADKAANSLVANLGSIPPDSCFKTAEVRDLKKLHWLRRGNPYLEQCRTISNSDAHCLEHINEANLTTQVKEWSTEAVVRALLQEWRLFAAAALWGSRYPFGTILWQRRVIEDSDNRLEMHRKIEFEPFYHMCYS